MFGKFSVRISLAFLAVFGLLLPLQKMFASSSHSYNMSGKVIAVAQDSRFVYEVESSDNVYTLACIQSRFKRVKCDWNGHPISIGDFVNFRINGIDAYMPVGAENEERFTVLMTEAKQLPPLPTVLIGYESAVVRGAGFTSSGSIPSVPVATTSVSSSGSVAPVLAVPAAGGAPTVVIPASPTTSPVIIGVPSTGGAPITAVAVTPSVDASPFIASTNAGPQWMRVLRVQTARHIYDLTCDVNNCKLNGKSLQIGDSLALRIEKNRAFVSSAGKSPERRFAILAVRNIDEATR